MVSNSFISARLKEKREELHLKQDQVAQLMGVNRNAISTYENGTREPSLGMVVRLARLYRVSTDYLLGVTDNRSVDISGLTEQEANLICGLVNEMAKKNENLFSN